MNKESDKSSIVNNKSKVLFFLKKNFIKPIVNTLPTNTTAGIIRIEQPQNTNERIIAITKIFLLEHL